MSTYPCCVWSVANRNTGYTPNFLMLGREIAVPDRLFGLNNILPKLEVPDYLEQLLKAMKYAHDAARSKLREAQKHQKLHYDLRIRQNGYEKGDLVYVIDTTSKVGQSSKLRPVHSGPYLITEVLSPILYRLLGKRRSFVVHHDRLRACQDRTIPMWIRKKRHDLISPDVADTLEFDGTTLQPIKKALYLGNIIGPNVDIHVVHHILSCAISMPFYTILAIVLMMLIKFQLFISHCNFAMVVH